MRVHKVLYGAGDQVIATVPHDHAHRPVRVTSGTYTIEDLRYSEGSTDRDVASGSFTHDNISIAITSAAGPSQSNDRLIQLGSSTGLVEGTVYLLSGLSGQEVVFAEKVDTTNHRVYTRNPIAGEYSATTSSISSVEIKCTFPDAETSDDQSIDDLGGPYVVTWTFTANSQKYIVAEQIFLERYNDIPFVTSHDIMQAYPALRLRIRNIASVDDAISVAIDEFLADVEAAGRNPSYFRASRAGKMAVRNKAIEYLLRWQQTENDDANADKWEKKYQDLVGTILTGKPPVSTVTINPVNNDAPAGDDRSYGQTVVRRS